MSEDMTLHPLDTDLLDYVEAIAEPALAERIEFHVAGCPICRVKLSRLHAAAPIPDVAAVEPERGLSYDLIDVEDVEGLHARPGELWLTSTDVATLVLVRAVRGVGSGVVVVPVVLDVEVADSSTLILDRDASPLGLPIAMFERLSTSVPTDALSGRIIPRSPVDLLAVTDADAGVSRGRPLEGPTDPRREVRQDLIDRLSVLTPVSPPAIARWETDAFDIDDFREQLLAWRGDACTVEPISALPFVAGASHSWVPMARVSEFGVRLVVIHTPAGLNEPADVVAARGLLVKMDASAVVVANELSDHVEVYEPSVMFSGFDLPEGSPRSRPLLGELNLVDAVVKFLDQKVRPAAVFGSSQTRADAVDVAAVLAERLVANLQDAIRRSSNFKPDKRQGFRDLELLQVEIGEALRAALSAGFDPSTLIDLVERRTK